MLGLEEVAFLLNEMPEFNSEVLDRFGDASIDFQYFLLRLISEGNHFSFLQLPEGPSPVQLLLCK